MPVPKYDELMDPVLQILKKLGGNAFVKEIDERVANYLSLTEEERSEIHKGYRTKLAYRLAWARYYLKKAGLLKTSGRGIWVLTEKGTNTISVNKEEIKREVKKRSDLEKKAKALHRKLLEYSPDEETTILEEEKIEQDFSDDIPTEEGNDGVEKEIIESYDIQEPFDPKLIDIKTKQMMLKALFERIQYNEVNLLTDFQREGNLWDLTRQSRLIESLLIRFPLPAFYFDGTNDDNWLIVDGLQRISSLKNYVIDRNFALTNLEFLKGIEGYTYDDLPRDLKRRIDETEITVYIISPGTPDKVKYNIFRRINTGGLVLEPQEIRNVINQGKPSVFIKELAELDEFRKATSYAIRTHRMLDKDFVTRFVSFYLNSYKYYEPDLDTFLNKGMADINKLSDQKLAEVKADFIKSMLACHEIFREYAFRKRYSLNDAHHPINKALFEVWSVSIARLTEDQITVLKKNSVELNQLFIKLLNENATFEKAISTATGDRFKVIRRFTDIELLINKIIL
jgi:hypothetical protein